MKLGEIYLWETDQAKGHESRDKYHLYIRDATWRTQAHTFLFINKSDYGGDYRVTKADYDFFTLKESYVSCGSIVTYTDQKLADFKPEYKGRLSIKHLKELHDAVAASETLEGWKINMICDVIRPLL